MGLVFNPFTGNLDFVGAGGGGGMIYPAAGVANSTGSSWGTSYPVSGSGTQLALTNSPTFVTPNLGIPSTLTLTNATGLPIGGISASGTPSASNFLRGDGSWATPAGMVYPSAGVAVSTGSAWGASYSTSGTGTQLALTASPTFTGPQTWTVGVRNGTGLSHSQTWNGGGTYEALVINVTDTSSTAASLLINTVVGGNFQFNVRKDGVVRAGLGTQAEPSYAFVGEVGTGIFRPSVGALGISANGLRVVTIDQGFGLNTSNYNITASNGGQFQLGSAGVVDLILRRGAAATLQLGAADVSVGNAVAQTLRPQSTTAAAQTAPDFTIQGSRGTTAGGGIVFQTAVTNAYANAFKLNADKTAIFYGNVTISTFNLVTDTTTGSKIGTATGQKLGFWNATPIAQPTTAIAAATVAATGTGDVVAASTTFDGYTIPQIVKALRDAGLLA